VQNTPKAFGEQCDLNPKVLSSKRSHHPGQSAKGAKLTESGATRVSAESGDNPILRAARLL